jgi:DsbE subfamily thiol:disulfide oxidoreductase
LSRHAPPRRLLSLVLPFLLAFATRAHAAPALTTAPSFRLPGRGAEVVSDSLRGRVVLVDFWASWCVPCRKSFPWLAAMQEKYGPQGLTVVGVNLDKTRPAADAFLAQVPAPFTLAFDPAGKTAAAWGVKGMPSTFLVGRDGTLVYAHVGFDPAKTESFEKRIEEALAK